MHALSCLLCLLCLPVIMLSLSFSLSYISTSLHKICSLSSLISAASQQWQGRRTTDMPGKAGGGDEHLVVMWWWRKRRKKKRTGDVTGRQAVVYFGTSFFRAFHSLLHIMSYHVSHFSLYASLVGCLRAFSSIFWMVFIHGWFSNNCFLTIICSISWVSSYRYIIYVNKGHRGVAYVVLVCKYVGLINNLWTMGIPNLNYIFLVLSLLNGPLLFSESTYNAFCSRIAAAARARMTCSVYNTLLVQWTISVNGESVMD